MTDKWDALPDNVKTFMTALDDREADGALATFTGASTTDTGIDVGQHLGGVADLHYRFTLDGALISQLVIEP